MSTRTVRIRESSYRILRELAQQTGSTMVKILGHALDDYHRKIFFEKLNEGYAVLKADARASRALEGEMKLWDRALMDGLDPDERWHNQAAICFPN
jgi:hypothetical protein